MVDGFVGFWAKKAEWIEVDTPYAVMTTRASYETNSVRNWNLYSTAQGSQPASCDSLIAFMEKPRFLLKYKTSKNYEWGPGHSLTVTH